MSRPFAALLLMTLPLLGATADVSASPAAPAKGVRAGTPAACKAPARSTLEAAVGAKVTILAGRSVAASASLPAYCEVRANIAPHIGVIVRLPADGGNGRLLVGGCGGLCGEIDMRSTEDALARGYTVAQTDMGHTGQNITFVDDPDAIEDFAWRSTHLTTVFAKALFDGIYGHRPRYNFFRGCSTGGRQAIVESQLFPDSFDGVIAGAPAHQMAAAHTVWAMRANMRPDNSIILDEPALRLLHAGAVGHCDAKDGRIDGIIDDPLQCDFKPEQLLCRPGAAAGTCLAPEQVGAAHKIYDGISTQAQKFYTSMGFAVGSELGWIDVLAGRPGQPPWGMGIATNYMHRFAQSPVPPRSLADLDFDRYPVVLNKVDAALGFGEDALLLQRFAQSGGKMIVYAGWADQALTPSTTLDWLADQQRGMGGAAATAPFMRQYMVPGLAHCGGGEGAGTIDFLSALENWVIRDKAPANLTAYRLSADAAGSGPPRFPLPPGSVKFERTIQPYALPRWIVERKTIASQTAR